MAPERHESLARQMRVLFSVGVAGGLTDGELLQTFAARDGEAAESAFAALVERHGPMVLRVCRQVLRDGHAAEDAFQAAFLVLARRARSLHVSNSLAPWLFQVAWRTASRLRSRVTRQRIHEAKAAAAACEVLSGVSWDDIGAALHEEIGRLPARHRVPLVLCYLEGLTALQVAEQLGWPPGTVRSRLARGRERLRSRLIRRGLALSSAAIVAILTADSALAAVPIRLADATTRAALLVAAGGVAAGAVPASILTLTEGVLQTMTMTKLKLMATVLAVGLATTALALAQERGGIGPGVAGKSADALVVGKQLRRKGGPFSDTTKRPMETPDNVLDPNIGPGASDAASDSGRLQAVERKLDRILQALGASRPEERRQSNDLAQTRDEPSSADPSFPKISNPRTLALDLVDVPGEASKTPPVDWKVRDLTGIQSRLGRVERTLDDLLERVKRLEDRSAKRADSDPFRNDKGN
jgi:RNA polymerase sigma factor (sigma-70 family)